MKPPPRQIPWASEGKARERTGAEAVAHFFAPIAEETAPTEANNHMAGYKPCESVLTAPRGAEPGEAVSGGGECEPKRAFFSFFFQSEAGFNGGRTTTPPLSDL